MGTSEVLFAFMGTLLFKSAISASINYEPIKITINENFNAQPGQVSPKFQALEPGVLHQGANFYFKPQLNLPQSFIPSHIEALISFIQQHQHSYVKDASFAAEKDKLMEILKPFMYPSSDIPKTTPSKIVFEKENVLEIVTAPEVISPALEEIVAEPQPLSVKITEEPKPVTELPVLPPLSLSSIHSIAEEKGELAIPEDQTGVFPTLTKITVRPIQEPIFNYVEAKPMISELINIPEAPVLPQLAANGIKPIQGGVKIEEPSVVNVESKPAIQELGEVSEAPVLPSLSLHDAPFIIEEEEKKEKSEILDDPTGVFFEVPEVPAVRPVQEKIFDFVEHKSFIGKFQVIPEAPLLPPLSVNGIKLIESGVKIEEPIVVDVESNSATPELLEILEEPLLPPLSFNDIPSKVQDEEKKEQLEISETTSKFPTIPEITVRPIQEPIINYNYPTSATSELGHIPNAPVLPPLLFNNIPPHIEKEVRNEESIILKEPTGTFSTIPEIAVRPVQKPIFNYIENKPMTSELINIPEAPVLSSFPFKSFTSIIQEEVKTEESVVMKGQKGTFPTISEITVRPIEEPIINYVEPKPFITEFQVIPEAPVLPASLANDVELVEEGMKIKEPIFVDVESKPAIQELEEIIPEAPLLPPLSVHDVPYIVEEEVKKEESKILEEPMHMFSIIPEVTVRPAQELTINNFEHKPFITEFQVIPEAPVLPAFLANDVELVEEGMKIKEPIFVDVESKPAIQELEKIIPEAPLLPPLSVHDVPYIVEEEVKKEESKILEEPMHMFSIIPEVTVRPAQELTINNFEHKPFITEFQVIPEAPVLPASLANDVELVEEGMKIKEPIFVDIESKPAIQDLEKVIPEAPLLPPLSVHDVAYIMEEEVKNEESKILEEPTRMFPIIPEVTVRPAHEQTINNFEHKPFITEFQVIPEAPILPAFLANDVELVEEGMKIKEPIFVDVESKPSIQELEEVIPEAPLLPPLSVRDVPYIMEEEVKKEDSKILEEPTGMFPIIPEVAIRSVQEPTINNVEPKPFITEFQVIPEAPVLPALLANDIHLIEEGMKIKEPIFVDVESKPAIQDLEKVIPEAPLLPPLSVHDVPYIMEEEGKKVESKILEEPTGMFSIIPDVTVRPIQEPTINNLEHTPFVTEFQVIPEAPKPVTSNYIVITEVPVLPALPFSGISSVGEEVKMEESIQVEESTVIFPENSAKHVALENINYSVPTEKLKIEIPILLEESIEVFPPIAEMPLKPTLVPVQEPEMTYTYELEEVSQPNPEHGITVKKLPPTIIPKPSNNLGLSSYAPFLSHLSNSAAKTKKLTIPKLASIDNFLPKRHPFRLAVTPLTKLSQNAMKSPIKQNKKQFLYPTSYAQDVVTKRITPNMGFKSNAPPKRVKIYIPSEVPKGPSYL